MDDLTKIKGIGPATATKLVAAGVDSFAKLAGATPDALGSGWVADARKLSPAPLDLNQAAPDQVEAQAARIDEARARLSAAQADLDALIGPGHQSGDTPSAHEMAGHWHGEISAIAAMLGLQEPDAGEVPAAVQALLADLSERKNALEEGSEDGVTGAVPTKPVADMDLVADFDRALEALNARIATELEAGVVAAMEFVVSERHRLQLIIEQVGRLDAELGRHEEEIPRTETVWPVTAIRFDGKVQPVGKPLKVDHATFLALTSSGAATDHPPENKPEEA